jgi:hypothetical protein
MEIDVDEEDLVIVLDEQIPLRDLRQPQLCPDREESEYLRPAALKAWKMVRQETLKHFIDSNIATTWEPISNDGVVFERWTGQSLLPSSREGTVTYRIKGYVDIPKDKRNRLFKMCTDFTESRRWDPLFDSSSLRVLENFPDENIQVVRWKSPLPAWATALGVYPRGGLSVICTDNKTWILFRQISEHRFISKDEMKDWVNADGWMGMYISKDGTTISLVVTINPLSQVYGIVASPLKDYYITLLKERLKLLKEVCDKWHYYYISE